MIDLNQSGTGTPPPIPPTQTPPPATPEPDAPPVVPEGGEPEYEEREDGSVVYADGYRIDAEGRHWDAEGNEVPEESPDAPPAGGEDGEPSGGTPPPAEPPAPATPPAPSPAAPVVPQTTNEARIYTQDNCFSQEELARLQTLDFENPAQAQAFRFQRWQQIASYAEDRFDEGLERLAQEAPDLVAKFQRQIDRARRQLTVEQKQMPGIVNQIAASLAVQELARDPKRLNDILTGKAPTDAPPARREPATVIPPEQRMPKPKTARRTVPNRGDAFSGSRSGDAVLRDMYPHMTDEERRQFTSGIRSSEERRG